MAEIVLEVCVDSLAGVEAAISGGADRIELCAALAVGGLTPSEGMMQEAAAAPVPVYAMIRPRSGDFVYSVGELQVMRTDIDRARDMGMAGVVLGASRADGSLDRAALEALVRWSDGIGRTLHRAFDLTGDGYAAAVELAVALGFERILTSGGAVTAVQGLARLQAVTALAAGRIGVMPGAGVTAETVGALRTGLPLREVHASCSVPAARAGRDIARLGFSGPAPRMTSTERVRALKAALGGG